tara:strand:+ start:164 stop:382 length:219 start_codon:yes stop_codon:yes gene_type:complete
MNLDVLLLNGYGVFVWPAFIFTFISCFFLYLATKKEMQKFEKMFLDEFKQIKIREIKTEKETLSDRPVFKTY